MAASAAIFNWSRSLILKCWFLQRAAAPRLQTAVFTAESNQSLKGKAVDFVTSADRFLIVVKDNNAIGFRH